MTLGVLCLHCKVDEGGSTWHVNSMTPDPHPRIRTEPLIIYGSEIVSQNLKSDVLEEFDINVHKPTLLAM